LEKPRLGDAVPEWGNVNYLALFSYVKSSRADAGLAAKVKDALAKYADSLLSQQAENPYGIAFAGKGSHFNWGSNSIVATTGFQLLLVYKLTGDPKYKSSAFKMADYLFGLNPMGTSYVTGVGEVFPKNPHFRPSMSRKYPVPKAFLVGGPNDVAYKGDLPGLALSKFPPMKIYADSIDSWATNEVAINWQSALVSLATLLVE
jgi:endoglucanase